MMTTLYHQQRKYIGEDTDSTLLWPYRTTPLVLPGAKVKKDFGQTESYLRHHPNPMFRQAPPHPLLPHELAMKQRISHKQFNSPMGLYSEQNIVDTINQQSGAQAPVNVPAPAPVSPVAFHPNFSLRQVQEPCEQ
uniref:PDZ and LIM domain protein 3 n=1 Tax=Lygus hesperus TaxID=30085 RepID=A0A0A9X8G9_LYGHE